MRIYCEHCGHSITFKRNHFAICSYCGYKVYPTEESKFKDKLKKAIIERKRKDEQSNSVRKSM